MESREVTLGMTGREGVCFLDASCLLLLKFDKTRILSPGKHFCISLIFMFAIVGNPGFYFSPGGYFNSDDVILRIIGFFF